MRAKLILAKLHQSEQGYANQYKQKALYRSEDEKKKFIDADYVSNGTIKNYIPTRITKRNPSFQQSENEKALSIFNTDR